MAELGQQTVDFSTLVARAAEESYVSLKELVEKSKGSDISDSEKKIGILKYVVKTQQRMLRLNVLAKWCQQVSFFLFSLISEFSPMFELLVYCMDLCGISFATEWFTVENVVFC